MVQIEISGAPTVQRIAVKFTATASSWVSTEKSHAVGRNPNPSIVLSRWAPMIFGKIFSSAAIFYVSALVIVCICLPSLVWLLFDDEVVRCNFVTLVSSSISPIVRWIWTIGIACAMQNFMMDAYTPVLRHCYALPIYFFSMWENHKSPQIRHSYSWRQHHTHRLGLRVCQPLPRHRGHGFVVFCRKLIWHADYLPNVCLLTWIFIWKRLLATKYDYPACSPNPDLPSCVGWEGCHLGDCCD